MEDALNEDLLNLPHLQVQLQKKVDLNELILNF